MSHNILIVEDSVSIRIGVKKILSEIGIVNCYEAGDGAEGIKVLNNLKKESITLNLILCDINMPNMNGIEFIKCVKKDDDFKKLNILMMSAENEKNIIVECVLLGASDYLLKPFNEETFKEKVLKNIKSS